MNKQEIVEEAVRRMKEEWPSHRAKMNRVAWPQLHMSMAHQMRQRSSDAQTSVGAFLTNDNNEPLSAGFNGFPRKVNDYALPNLRPAKYPWMAHAEMNVIAHCARTGVSTDDTILYVTGLPCTRCTLLCWQAGISKIVYDPDLPINMNDEETLIWHEQFRIIRAGRMPIVPMKYQGNL